MGTSVQRNNTGGGPTAFVWLPTQASTPKYISLGALFGFSVSAISLGCCPQPCPPRQQAHAARATVPIATNCLPALVISMILVRRASFSASSSLMTHWETSHQIPLAYRNPQGTPAHSALL